MRTAFFTRVIHYGLPAVSREKILLFYARHQKNLLFTKLDQSRTVDIDLVFFLRGYIHNKRILSWPISIHLLNNHIYAWGLSKFDWHVTCKPYCRTSRRVSHFCGTVKGEFKLSENP